ncbi:hypothetical protein CBW65_16350 [Tumebacillus avium]|uniref:Uncharacterized protein n=1 Tax=Tumebacillus avium TaxID=1903704 RepID=A0A1Y0IPE3_9BACL|nr:hypothetical protein [Tumebacillus avium]ARU62357.1 hypothetical protein CBW65_16350 [Tumebacillus avium]
MEERVRQEQGTAKFAVVFLVIFALGFILAETMPDQQQANLLAVVFGVCLALTGASIAEENEKRASSS